MTTLEIYSEPKAARAKRAAKQPNAAKPPKDPSTKKAPPRITAAMAARWVRRGRAYNP